MDPKTFLKELMINVGFSALNYNANIKNMFFNFPNSSMPDPNMWKYMKLSIVL